MSGGHDDHGHGGGSGSKYDAPYVQPVKAVGGILKSIFSMGSGGSGGGHHDDHGHH
jgi:hypothetical protein